MVCVLLQTHEECLLGCHLQHFFWGVLGEQSLRDECCVVAVGCGIVGGKVVGDGVVVGEVFVHVVGGDIAEMVLLRVQMNGCCIRFYAWTFATWDFFGGCCF